MTAATGTALQVTPLSGWTGALITGVDLSGPLSADEIETIRTALHQWKVVFFRDQALDHAAQIAFGAQFGDVTPGHPYEGDSAPPGFPQIHTVSPAASRSWMRSSTAVAAWSFCRSTSTGVAGEIETRGPCLSSAAL